MTTKRKRAFAPRYPTELVNDVLLAYQASGNARATAEQFGISGHTVRAWQRRYGRVEEPDQPLPQRPADYAVFNWLLARLPDDSRWTQSQRDCWVAALVAMIDLVIEVADAPEEPTP